MGEHELDLCLCGAYRRDHVDGRSTQGWRDCEKFQLWQSNEALEISARARAHNAMLTNRVQAKRADAGRGNSDDSQACVSSSLT